MGRLPEWAKDAIYNNTGFHFSFTEVILSRIWFEKPKWMPQPKRQGYEEVNSR